MNFIKSYEIYKGKTFKSAIGCYLLLDILLAFCFCFFLKVDNFGRISNSMSVGVYTASYVFFTTLMAESSTLFRKKQCYYLTFNNSKEIRIKYYFTSYFSLIGSLAIFVLLTYLIGGLYKVLPDNVILHFTTDMVSLLVLFSIVPFVLITKNGTGFISWKAAIVILPFIVIKSIALSKTNWIIVIVFAVLSLVLMFISNKRWIKYLGELYDKE